MPRSMSYHPQLEQLVYAPLEESAALRVMPPLADVQGVEVNSSHSYELGRFGARVSNGGGGGGPSHQCPLARDRRPVRLCMC